MNFIGGLLESLTQGFLVGKLLVGGLGVQNAIDVIVIISIIIINIIIIIINISIISMFTVIMYTVSIIVMCNLYIYIYMYIYVHIVGVSLCIVNIMSYCLAFSVLFVMLCLHARTVCKQDTAHHMHFRKYASSPNEHTILDLRRGKVI